MELQGQTVEAVPLLAAVEIDAGSLYQRLQLHAQIRVGKRGHAHLGPGIDGDLPGDPGEVAVGGLLGSGKACQAALRGVGDIGRSCRLAENGQDAVGPVEAASIILSSDLADTVSTNSWAPVFEADARSASTMSHGPLRKGAGGMDILPDDGIM